MKIILKCNNVNCGKTIKGKVDSDDLETARKVTQKCDCGGVYIFEKVNDQVQDKNVPVKKEKVPKASRKSTTEEDIETENESNEEVEFICNLCDKNPESKGKHDPKKKRIGHNLGKYRGFDPCPRSEEKITLCYARDMHIRGNKFPPYLDVSNDVDGIVVQKQLIKIDDIKRLFVARTDRFSLYDNRDRGKSQPRVKDVEQELTDGIIGLHLLGSITIGVRPWNQRDYTGLWICYDIDKKDNDGNIIVNNPEETVDSIIDLLKEWYGLNGYPEMSGSEGSYHIWIFLKPTNYSKIMEFDQAFYERCEKEEQYNYVNKVIQKRVEDDSGRMIKLPCGINIKNGVRSRFIDGIDISKIEPQELPPPWGNQTAVSDVDKVAETSEPIVESIQDKEYRINKILNELYKPDNEGMITVSSLKCDCKTFDNFKNTKEKIKKILLNPHDECGGNVKLKIYQTKLDILHSCEEVEMIMENRYNQPDDKKFRMFAYEIKGNELLIKLATYNDAYGEAMYLSGLSNTYYRKLKGMLGTVLKQTA